jgi:capsular polysaccharide transport system ATP-binding protein
MIQLSDVTKVYHTRSGPNKVLDDVSFSLRTGQAIGIMGRNGAGKSTLTRIISGVEYPTSGSVERNMTVSWPLGYAGAFQASLSGADNTRYVARIYGVPIKETLEFVEDFAQLGAYFRMPIKTYSAGMHARLAFGVSLAIDFDCYLVDEVVGAGDHRFAERCQNALRERRERGALLMISHDIRALEAYCDTGAVLAGGKLTFFDTLEDTYRAYLEL